MLKLQFSKNFYGNRIFLTLLAPKMKLF